MNISEAAQLAGLTAKMIRNYEEIDLIKPARRNDSNYRIYSEKDLAQLRFIRRARALGFSLVDIKILLELWQNRTRSSGDVKKLALSHIDILQNKLVTLQNMIDTLNHLAHNCHGDGRPDCPILEILAGDECCH